MRYVQCTLCTNDWFDLAFLERFHEEASKYRTQPVTHDGTMHLSVLISLKIERVVFYTQLNQGYELLHWWGRPTFLLEVVRISIMRSSHQIAPLQRAAHQDHKPPALVIIWFMLYIVCITYRCRSLKFYRAEYTRYHASFTNEDP